MPAPVVAVLRTLILACALLTLAVAPSAEAVAMTGPTVIKAKESGCPAGKFFCFDPMEVSIPVAAGPQTFQLDNSAGAAGHNLCIVVGTSTSCAPGPTTSELAPPGSNNATVSVTLAAGKYVFYCAPHRTIGMEGNITVTASATPTPPPSPPPNPPPSPPSPPPSTPPASSTPGFDVAVLALSAVVVALAARRR